MAAQSAGPDVPADSDQPVFVDQTGRRRRVTVLAGAGIAAGLLVSLGLIIAGLFGGSPVPLPGWPEANVQQEKGTKPLETIELTPSPIPTVTEPTPPTRDEPSTAPPTTQTTTTDRPGAGETTHTPPGRRPSKSPGKPR